MTGPEQGWPLSATQQGIWLDEKRADQGSSYCMPFLLTLDGQVDVAALVSACLTVVTRHPLLSCSVGEDSGGRPRLVPAPNPPEVVTADLRDTPEAGLDARLGSAVEAGIRMPFDLAGGPLIRLTLFLPQSRPPVLLLVAHHLVFDRQSMDIFARDLAACYEGAVAGRKPNLPPTGPELWAYLDAETHRVADALPPAREYWSARWREPTALSLPHASRATPGMLEGIHPADCTECLLGQREHGRLRAAADSIGVTKFEYLLASLCVLLYRYGNDAPGVSIALGQRTGSSAAMIGPFVQEVPFTPGLATGLRFADFARGLRGDLRELYRFRRVPLGLAVPGISPAALRSSVSISYARHHTAIETPHLRIAWRFLFNFRSRSPVSISVLDEGGLMRVMMRHSPAFIDGQGAASIARQWRRLSYAGAVCPASLIADLPLLDRRERNQAAARFTTTQASDLGGTLPQLFSAQAARAPDRIAAIHGGDSISYKRLDAESGRLADHLLRAGIGAGSVAAIFMRPSIRRLLTVLAVLKTGGAYLPLELRSPPARLGAIIEDAQASIVLADEPSDAGPFGPGVRVLAVDNAEAGAEPGGERAVSRPARDRDLAYVIYTSGSTGQPKGVAIEHHALSNLLRAFRDVTGSGADATWLAHSSLAFDMSVLELCLPLITGGTVVIAQDHAARNAAELIRLIRAHRVTHLQATPSGWQLLLDAGFDEPGIAAIVGGEALTLPLSQRLRPRVRRLWNAYGPTEATVWASYAEVCRDADQVTIGRPIAGLRAYILGNRGDIVPAGCAGELFIGGRGLARGYAHDPAQTASRFVADPFGAPGARMYRTGDRARHRADGSIEFLGRLDDQVKVRGHRIELGEVEARLAAHPSVRRCAVAASGDEGLGRRLVAFMTLADGRSAPRSELRGWMSKLLPSYMLPSAYVLLDRFPLTPTGKLDRAALPDPDIPEPRDHGPGQPEPAPGGSLEQEIRQVCQQILRAGDIGLDEDLFGFGANSLVIMQIARRIAIRTGVDIPLEMLFEAPSVLGIAQLVGDAKRDGQHPEAW
jgi:amino acid adenylation domain-containing protein